VAAVPAIGEDRETALAVLEATVELWGGGSAAPTGFINVDVWARGYETLRRLGFIDGSVTLGEMLAEVLASDG